MRTARGSGLPAGHAEPRVLEILRRDPTLIPNAVAEILRTGFGMGGIAGTTRYAVGEVELRGKTISKGQMLMLSIDGAGRDPAVSTIPTASTSRAR